MATQFDIAEVDEALVSLIQSEFGLPSFLARTMVAHGVSSVEDARVFLTPDLDRDWLDPYLVCGMKSVVDRLEVALKRRERIVVFGDFDLDGISATTVLTRGLRKLGATVEPIIPRRFEEGYGLTPKAIQRAGAFHPQLIVTVDCGISCKNEVHLVHELGAELIITDHHEAGDMMPEGIPVTDPKIEENSPSASLAGVGVALKVVQALGARLGQPYLWLEYTDLATLGTVADLMPLRSENRALVAHGIACMNSHPRPCIAALIEACRAGDKPLSASNLSFSLIPRLNAAGRMGDADLALHVLMEDDYERAHELAQKLEAVNDKRRLIEAELAQVAREQAESMYHGQRALVVAGEGWHEGVKGIVASRLANTYGVPSILLTIDGDEARGSGRSVGSVNLYKAVESTSDILTRFGGHEAAVGVTLPVDKIPEFNERLCAYMDTLDEDSFHPAFKIDAVVDLEELTLENVEKLEMLAPFGQENPQPCYLAKSVRLSSCRAVGMTKNHLSCALTDGLATVDGIMFNCENLCSLLHCGSVVDAAFEVQVDEWRGRRNVKCMMKTIIPFESCPALRACLPSDDVEFVRSLCEEIHEHDQNPDRAYAHAFRVEHGVMQTEDGEICPPGECRKYWYDIAQNHPEKLREKLIAAFIGEASLHSSQQEALDALSKGHNVLAVMGTGRGKSLIFQVFAAYLALTEHKASLFVYPLRALIADQAFHIKQALSQFGLSVCALTGETPQEQREKAYAKLALGELDIVLTTPEYLEFHVDEFARSSRIGFVVADEAHHMEQLGSGKRPAYEHFADLVHVLGDPRVLALTATAPSKVFRGLVERLDIKHYVFDDFTRSNLSIDDHRNLRDKDSYVSSIISTGEKTVIYVNSRAGAVELVRNLRAMVPHVAPQIGFYHAGLAREERNRVEKLFRDDVLRVLVCTSAFGEGVNIPNIRHVVLYHMPFSEVEFNQMSGRAGRDGREAVVHIVFSKYDASINEGMLHSYVPDRDTMAQVYRELRCMQREHDALVAGAHDIVAQAPSAAQGMAASGVARVDVQDAPVDTQDALVGDTAAFALSYAQVAQRCCARLSQIAVDDQMCERAIEVFHELGLVDVYTPQLAICVRQTDQKVELTDSVRYREGLGEIDAFAQFKNWALSADDDSLNNRIRRPILPQMIVGKGGRHD